MALAKRIKIQNIKISKINEVNNWAPNAFGVTWRFDNVFRPSI